MNLEPLRELERVIGLVSKAAPGLWQFFEEPLRPNYPVRVMEIQQKNGLAVIPWAGFDDPDKTKAAKRANAKAIIAAVNFIREHGPALSRALAQLDDGWQKDAERLDWLDDINSRGWAPAIVNDDGGRYAFSDSGMSPVPEEGGHKEPVSITAFVEPHMWRGTIREAIDAAMAEDDVALPLPSPPAQEAT